MTIPFADTKAFSKIFLDYLQKNDFLKDFYNQYPTIENFGFQMSEKKSFPPSHRNILVETLKKQYAEIYSNPHFPEKSPKKEVLENIEALSLPNTFTITTGHQLTFLGSPAYFVYKILTTIKLTQQLKQQYPEYNFVPVYWLASEDHDFEEVNHTYLFGKKYTWNTAQSGAVGDFEMKDLENVFAEMPQNLPDFFVKVKNIYTNASNLSQATRLLVDEWFGEKGLVCVEPQEKGLKRVFEKVIKEDIFENKVFKVVKKSTEKFATKYKPQINAREINFFYIGKNPQTQQAFRDRIIKNEKGDFEVLNQNIYFSETELLTQIETNPHHFSPNVVLRPLYQEQILPNLAYVGGAGELAYWLQLKDMFGAMNTPFPVLMPRNFATIFPKNATQKLEKMNLLPKDLFLDELELKKRFLHQKTEQLADTSKEKQQIEQAFTQIIQKTEVLDKSLVAWAGAEQQKIWKIWENIEKRLEKTEELRSETDIKQLLALREKIMPEGTLQERKESFLSFWLNNPNLLEEIYTKFDAFQMEMYVF